jgi:N-methylhydantoinase B/oxoprolinase/acetone carboxylase alpha subunit
LKAFLLRQGRRYPGRAGWTQPYRRWVADLGEPGALGRQWIERADGRIDELPGCAKAELEPGDVFVIQTPAGGGFGAPETR